MREQMVLYNKDLVIFACILSSSDRSKTRVFLGDDEPRTLELRSGNENRTWANHTSPNFSTTSAQRQLDIMDLVRTKSTYTLALQRNRVLHLEPSSHEPTDSKLL
ncbi:uncharacterized protein LOC129988853 [Argiope bruennichi]|uniref:uncharacterized protein LOC129988853 n=1 Tax=Argiope bruennichi TaxID=94029 RepID=UPI0024944BA2|nr:uncharacterized protein LOC129988853 [Argiope bruennichi]